MFVYSTTSCASQLKLVKLRLNSIFNFYIQHKCQQCKRRYQRSNRSTKYLISILILIAFIGGVIGIFYKNNINLPLHILQEIKKRVK